MPEIGQRIRSMRGMLGLSRAEFCRRIAITPASLRNYEEGTASPNAASLIKICQEFDVSVQWLLLGTKPMFVTDMEQAPPTSFDNRGLSEEVSLRCRLENADATFASVPGDPRILDELYKAMDLVRDLSGRNAALAEKVNELQEKAYALELENVRLTAGRTLASAVPGVRSKKNGHIDRMPLVAPGGRLQEPEPK